MHIFYANISFLKNLEKIEKNKSFVSSFRLAQIEKYKAIEDKARSLGATLLLTEMIKVYAPKVEIPLEFDKNEFGKPFILNQKNINFSISHAGDFCACGICFGEENKIGVDIEKKRQYKKGNKAIVNRFFSKDEGTFVENAQTQEQKEKNFLTIWTRKESYVKATGEGLYAPINEICTIQDDGFVLRKEQKMPFLVKTFYLQNDYALSICFGGKEFEGVKKIKSPNLFDLSLIY